MKTRYLLPALFLILSPNAIHADDAALRGEATKALRKATDFFRTQVSIEGGYLWRYSDDLARREGEAKATATTAWVQPPGTPTVGTALLAAYQATGDAYYLDAAKETAYALVKGQLRSGGWDYRIEFNPTLRKSNAYRVDGGTGKARNTTTLDDNNTQSALRYLMAVDRILQFKEPKIHDAVMYALESLLKAQFPNGAWPQRFDGPPDADKYPVKKASYPESWSRTFPNVDYRGFYTFNDNSIADMVDTMLEATETYGDAKYKTAAAKAGDFILLAQMPEPQPAWAQQYDADMHPAWARKFEPPSVTGGESFGVMRTLITLYRETGDKKFLEPIPRALDYLRRSRLPDGRLARFYEFKTNKPLYFTKDYVLTFSDADMPTHYAFKVPDRTETIAKEYEKAKAASPNDLKKPRKPERQKLSADLASQAKAVIAALDDKGRWVTDGRLRYHGPEDPTRRIIDTQTFVRNLNILTSYLAATKKD